MPGEVEPSSDFEGRTISGTKGVTAGAVRLRGSYRRA